MTFCDATPRPCRRCATVILLGTGFIFDRQGYVLTNYHVISGYEEIVIRLADGTEFAGDSLKVIGTDPWSDLAVLKDRDPPPPARGQARQLGPA